MAKPATAGELLPVISAKKCCGRPDVTVRVLKSNGVFVSAVADRDGAYLFEKVPAGKHQVKIVRPKGYGAKVVVLIVQVLDQKMSTADFRLF